LILTIATASTLRKKTPDITLPQLSSNLTASDAARSVSAFLSLCFLGLINMFKS
jgi:hypothetical protein